MKLTETIEVVTPGEVQIIEYFTLEPCKGGINMSAKSPLFAEWIAGLALPGETPSRSTKWGGAYHLIDPARVKLPPASFIDPIGGDLVKIGGGGNYVNLAWLRNTKLGEGMTIKIPIMAAADYEDIIPMMSDALRVLYVQNIRKNILTLRMKENFK